MPRAAVASIDIRQDGVPGQRAAVLKIRMRDKLRALELLGRHLGLFADRLEVNLSGSLAERMIAARNRRLRMSTIDQE